MSSKTLDKLFNSRLRIKLLKLMFRNYPGNFDAYELSKRIQESFEETKKELSLLAGIGLIIKNK